MQALALATPVVWCLILVLLLRLSRWLWMALLAHPAEMAWCNVCPKLLHQMSRSTTALPAFTMAVTLVSTLMIWVLDVVHFVMLLMLPTDSLGGVLVLVSVIWHNKCSFDSIVMGLREIEIKENAGFRIPDLAFRDWEEQEMERYKWYQRMQEAKG
jgi:hypothetical protein